MLPALALATLIVVQLAMAGWGLWAAAIAARAGARAAVVGRDAVPVARRALPDALRGGALIDGGGKVEVRVRVPRLVPGLPVLRVGASARLSPGGGHG